MSGVAPLTMARASIVKPGLFVSAGIAAGTRVLVILAYLAAVKAPEQTWAPVLAASCLLGFVIGLAVGPFDYPLVGFLLGATLSVLSAMFSVSLLSCCALEHFRLFEGIQHADEGLFAVIAIGLTGGVAGGVGGYLNQKAAAQARADRMARLKEKYADESDQFLARTLELGVVDYEAEEAIRGILRERALRDCD
jgi:hypothetical protein